MHIHSVRQTHRETHTHTLSPLLLEIVNRQEFSQQGSSMERAATSASDMPGVTGKPYSVASFKIRCVKERPQESAYQIQSISGAHAHVTHAAIPFSRFHSLPVSSLQSKATADVEHGCGE